MGPAQAAAAADSSEHVCEVNNAFDNALADHISKQTRSGAHAHDAPCPALIPECLQAERSKRACNSTHTSQPPVTHVHTSVHN